MNELQQPAETVYFDSYEGLMSAIEKIVKETEVVLDIGCGIAPMNYFRPKLHFMVEPWKEYSDILTYRHAGDKSVVILRTGALEALRSFADNAVDSIFLLDVIEHLEKEDGQQIILECERVARQQVVIFTPLGFMPQHIENDELDGWGLSGTSVQEHRSGWMPSDFSSSWSFYICKKFHLTDGKGDVLDEPFGAFFAVRNLEEKTIMKPEKLADYRRPLPAEIALQQLQAEHRELQEQYAHLIQSCDALSSKYQLLKNHMCFRFIQRIKNKFSGSEK